MQLLCILLINHLGSHWLTFHIHNHFYLASNYDYALSFHFPDIISTTTASTEQELNPDAPSSFYTDSVDNMW